jgi:flagellar hook assembly protein FlgD
MTALMCAATASFAQSPDFVNVAVSPTPFSPNGDGIRDVLSITYELAEDAEWVIVAVKDSQDDLVVTLIDGLPQSAGVTHQLVWDGDDDGSFPAPNGVYTVQFGSGNSAGQDDDMREIKLDSARPELGPLNLSHDPFTPDLPGSPDSLEITLSVSNSNTLDTPDSLLIAVGPRGESPIDTLAHRPAFGGDGVYEATWRPGGREDGRYQVYAFIADDAGNSSSVTVPFTLDTSAPLVGILDPPDGSVFRDLPDSTFGIAYDPGGVAGIEIRYNSGDYVPVAFVAEDDTARWGAVLGDSLPASGEHVVEVRATDTWGYTGSGGDLLGPSSITVTRDTEAPPVPSIDPLPEYVRTDALKLSGIALQAATVSIFVNNMIDPEVTVEASIGGTFSVDIVLEPGLNSIAASATDEAGNTSALSAPLSVEYRLQFGVFFNKRFRPGDSFEVSLEEPAQRVVLTLYSMSGRLVKVLRADGLSKSFSLKWNGDDDSGSSVNNGVYLCTVMAVLQNGSEVTDKKLVALVR